jgi:hypothetical protein
MRLKAILVTLLVSVPVALAGSDLEIGQHDVQGYPAAAVNLLSEDHTLYALTKREESTAPFVAALHYITKQQKELQGLITNNETLSQGWRPVSHHPPIKWSEFLTFCPHRSGTRMSYFPHISGKCTASPLVGGQMRFMIRTPAGPITLAQKEGPKRKSMPL